MQVNDDVDYDVNGASLKRLKKDTSAEFDPLGHQMARKLSTWKP